MDFSELMAFQGFIYLNQIWEPRDNHLSLYINRCKISETAEDMELGGVVLNTRSFEVDKALPMLRIDFDWYIAYSVRNEGYTVKDEYEVAVGTAFQIYTKSRYLDFIDLSTIASDDHPGPFKHYGINALNHIIDIVSTEPPTIIEVQRDVSIED